MKKIVATLLVVLLGLFAYVNRERVRTLWQRAGGAGEQVGEGPSPERAAAAEKKLEGLRNGHLKMVALTGSDLQSLLQYKYRGLLPAFVDSPQIELANDRIHIRARVPVDRLPQLHELGEAAAFLPDTTELGVDGQLLPIGEGRVALAINRVSAARIPLPKRLVPGALKRLGREDEPGLPPEAFAIRLPPGASAAYVRDGSLVLLSPEK